MAVATFMTYLRKKNDKEIFKARKPFIHYFSALFLIILLSSCTSMSLPDWIDTEGAREKARNTGESKGKIQDNFAIFQSDVKDTGANIGVNALLWRASLDTISFMPLDQADPYGGIITTEWYNNPDNPNERYKIIIYILDKRLRADAIRVAFFMQQLVNGEWVNVTASEETRIALENSILTRARQMKQE